MSMFRFCKKSDCFSGLLFVPFLILMGTNVHGSSQQTSSDLSNQISNYETIDWIDLIPKEDLDILLNPPSYITDVEDGSIEDKIGSQLKTDPVAVENDRYQQALISKSIKPEMDEKKVRVPGFIVPLEFNDEQIITEFFLVPYFGACIHMPPPPPNQIIYVKYPKGLILEALYHPFWISGKLKTSLIENDMATAAYTLDMENYEPYSEE
tara:strand:- start:24 stop:650 length:627 start_codon:yes stop_codon:yes gene_type:complete